MLTTRKADSTNRIVKLNRLFHFDAKSVVKTT